MNKLKCVKAKITLWRVLKVIFYVCGYPLFHYFARLAIQSYPGGMAGSAQLALNIINYVWIGLAVVQIAMMFIAKTKRVRALVVGIFAAVCMCAPIAYIQTAVKSDYNEVKAEIDAAHEEAEVAEITEKWDALIAKAKDADKKAALEEKKQEEIAQTIADGDYKITSWEDMYFDYESVANKYNSLYNTYCDYYNISYSSTVKGSKNTDGSEYTYDAEADAYYSENGLYADGYIFGYKQARYIHETYIAYRAKCEANGEDADVKLAAAIAALESNPNSEWNKYKKTAEYQAAYGEDGTALKYYLHEDRLNDVLSALGAALEDTKLMDSISSILPMFSSMIPEDFPVNDVLAAINKDLSMDDVVPILEMFGLSEDDFWDLLESYSFYQSPSTYPVFHFIEDEELREYATVLYEGKTHGAAIGSVLIGDKVGEITLSESGNKAMTDEELTELFAKIDEMAKYVPDFAPYFSYIEYLYIFAGVVPCAFFLSYLFSELEKKTFDKYLTLKEAK